MGGRCDLTHGPSSARQANNLIQNPRQLRLTERLDVSILVYTFK